MTALVVAATAVGWCVVATALGLFFGAVCRLDKAHRLVPEVVVPDHVPAAWTEVHR